MKYHVMECDAPIKNDDVQVEGSKYKITEEKQVTKQNSVFYFCKIICFYMWAHMCV